MTIEERATMFGLSHTKDIADGIRPWAVTRMHDLYKEIATEQEVITKQEMIEKAKEWVKEFCTETNYAKDEIPIIVKSIELFMKE